MVYLRKTELSQLYSVQKKQHKQRVKSLRIKKLSSTKNGDSQNKKEKTKKNRKQTLSTYIYICIKIDMFIYKSGKSFAHSGSPKYAEKGRRCA